MSTRGCLGFVIDGEEKITYNHFDSYPSGLGSDMLEWLKSLEGPKLQEAVDQARALRVVSENGPPTDEEIERLSHLADTNVYGSGKGVREWYVLLRRTQGDPQAILDAGVLIDGNEFVNDSLFCEWGYIVDFDRAVFEVYRGFQKAPHTEGRFHNRPIEEHSVGTYHPIKLVGTFSLEQLPDPDVFCKAVDPEEEEED